METSCCAGSNIAGLTMNPPRPRWPGPICWRRSPIAALRCCALRAEHPSATLGAACLQLGQSLRLLERAASLDVLRGVEGDAARIYFSVFDQLILHQKDGLLLPRAQPPASNG